MTNHGDAETDTPVWYQKTKTWICMWSTKGSATTDTHNAHVNANRQ